jgi:hypothetical protein
LPAVDVMNAATPNPSEPDPALRRQEWSREVFAAAEAIRRSGRHHGLREVTIVLPIDYEAVAAMELACQALGQGELSPATRDLDRLFDRVEKSPGLASQFLTSLHSVIRRLGPLTSST